MTRFIRYLRQNQITLIMILSVIAFAIFMVKSLDKNISEEVKNSDNIVSTQEEQVNQLENKENTDKESREQIYLVMDKFVKYCNQGDYELAYELLSEDCKQNNYKTAEIFNTKYIKTLFSEYLDYTMSLYKKTDNSYIYNVVFKTDAMISKNSKVVSKNKYYTFVLDGTGNFKIDIE